METGGNMAITPIRQKWKSAMSDRERFNRQLHYQKSILTFSTPEGSLIFLP